MMNDIDKQIIDIYKEVKQEAKKLIEEKGADNVTVNDIIELHNSEKIQNILSKCPTYKDMSCTERSLKLLKLAILPSNPLELSDEEFYSLFYISRDDAQKSSFSLDPHIHVTKCFDELSEEIKTRPFLSLNATDVLLDDVSKEVVCDI